MKSLILVLFLILSVSAFAKKNPVKSNAAIEEISWALESARWDYAQAMTVNFEESLDRVDLECEVRSHNEAIKLFGRAINGFRGYFPDEELPYSAALDGLSSILSGSELDYCATDFDGVKVWQIYLGEEYLFSVEQ
ncbi:hypothetical protein [Halobacteriovorax sp. JY17]|uniref:hypothetical protein n=1 Tax=Halobacteriovorax sp. JY17 TaxID=2014617 RepID=UPI000C575418|nr:hypothetical protein [Halobacteriovorax sp. JY17]PIK16153.1 MAG: hypothetical protein CES88_05310 [Halobacteriovorax sp. JY17]